jgi:hypothetical protein
MAKYRIIKEDDLRRLLRGYLKMLALQSGGVVNWEWYGESQWDFLAEWAQEKGIDIWSEEFEDLTIDDIVEEDIKKYPEFSVDFEADGR